MTHELSVRVCVSF